MPELDWRVSAGALLNLGLVLVSAISLFLQQLGVHDDNLKRQDQEITAITALAQRMTDMSERVQALSLGNTQRFTSIDDAQSQISKRLDSIQTSVQNINDRLVIQEAKASALQDEIKTIVVSKSK